MSKTLSSTLTPISTTGSGSVVLANSAVLVTPNIGTPVFGNLTNCIFPSAPYDTANTALTTGQNAFGQANAAYGQANTGITLTQAAFGQANVAYNTANTKFSANGGTIFGSVTITTDLNVNGNVYLGGNVTTLSSNNLSVSDPLIYLGQDNPANINDIGLVGHFTSNKYQHTGIVRDATDGVWKLFSNVSAEPTTTIDFSSDVIYDPLKVGSIITSNAVFLVANGTVPFIVSSNTLIPNLNVDLLDGQHGSYYIGLTSSAFDQANAAYTRANTETIGQAAFTQANTALTVGQSAFAAANTETIGKAAFTQANTALTVGQSAFSQANAAYTQANTALTVGQSAFGQANLAYAQANTGITVGQSAFGQANSAYTQANTALTVGQSAFGQANLAYAQANTGILVGQGAFVQANSEPIGQSAFGQANSAYTQANTGVAIANSAYTKANTIPALISTSIQTTNYTASVNDLVRCNTAAGAFSVTFPSSPTDGGTIAIIDITGTFATNNLTLLPNGKMIEFDSTSIILDLNGSYASFVYNSTTSNWKLLETPVGVIPVPTGNTGNVLTSDGSNWISLALPPAFGQANSAYTQANTALTVGQSAFGQANTALTVGQSAFGQANLAYTQANTGVAIANAAFAKANSGGGGVALSNDVTTNYNYNILLANSSSGTLATANTSNTKLYFNANTGTLYSTIFQSLSDETVKNNIIQISNSLFKVNQIIGVEFNWKDNGKPSAGIIAQQLEEILPVLVNTGDNGLKSVNYSGIIGYLIEAIKELNREIIELKNIVNKT